ncbi:MAG TPA: TIGR03435 family protein [Verrucomicrobiae bacterium]|nr:TIGR03435 family protein [Verrucomicrobiae bacterium]
MLPKIEEFLVAVCTSRSSFGVASVKPNQAGSEDSGIGRRGSTLAAINTTLRILIQTAYRPPDERPLSDDQVVGGSGWIDHFDVEAKPPDDARFPPPGEIASVLPSLLEGRFQSKAHVSVLRSMEAETGTGSG